MSTERKTGKHPNLGAPYGIEQHPFTQASNVAKKTIDYLADLDVKAGIAGCAMATVFTLLLELAPDNECRCYIMSHLLSALYSARERFGISDEALTKQCVETNEELAAYIDKLMLLHTEGKSAN